MTTVLLVGRRRGALNAAAELGLEVVCVDEKPQRRRDRELIAHFVEHPLDGPEEDWEEIAHRLADIGPIAAVYAGGERAVIPAAHLRHHLGLAGDSLEAAVRCTDKLKMKRTMTAAGIRCTRFVGDDQGMSAAELVAVLGLPMVAKPRVGMGGRENRVYQTPDEVEPLAPGWMAESFVDGVEMSAESLVRGGRPVFFNPTEYYQVRWANIVPAGLPDDVRRSVEKLNSAAITAVGVDTAWTHMELFLTPTGLIFSEMAARPPGGYISNLIGLAYGFDPWNHWLRLGLGEDVEPPPAPRRVAGAWLFHPGRGVVKSVDGIEEARALDGVERVELRLKPGKTVTERIGSGQETGHVLVTGRDRDQIVLRLAEAHASIRVEMEPEMEPSRGTLHQMDAARATDSGSRRRGARRHEDRQREHRRREDRQ